VTVLLADQNLMFARAVADRALVMERGRLVHAASRPTSPGTIPRSSAFSRSDVVRGVISTPGARSHPA
jgi:ABC-type polar amino acid transport system ATPase subunit